MKNVIVMAAVAVAMAGTAFAAESISRTKTIYTNGTMVQAEEKVSVDGDLRRTERIEQVMAGPGKGNKRLSYTEESGRFGKIAIKETSTDGRVAMAEGLYLRY